MPFKAKVLQLKYVNGLTAKKAVEEALSQFPSLQLEKSYFTRSGSHVGRFRSEFERAAEKGDLDVVALCQKYGLKFRQRVDE